MDLFAHYLTLPYLLQGISLTLQVTALGLAGGLFMGLVLASMQLSRFRFLAMLARTYTIIFRGTPLILQMVFAYDALPQLGLKLSAIAAAGLALAANEAPFIAEILRSGVRGVDPGQVSAGQALGMTPSVLMQRIIAPQAIRSMIPAFGNEAVTALKNSSLASFIAVQELTLRSTQLASSTFDFFSIFFASGVMYLALTGSFSALQIAAEVLLDLDRPGPRQLLARFLQPWRRDELVTPAGTTHVEPSAAVASQADNAVPTPRVTTLTSHHDRATELAHQAVAVDITDLQKHYGEQVVLNGINLSVRSGEVVALLGPSGSGKSTMLRCINRLEDWDGGNIRVAGRSLARLDNGKAMTPRAIARARADVGVGMVFQQFNLFSHLSALENVAGPLRWVYGQSKPEANRRASELLERVGLSHRAHALPRHLSGGQQQRVAIARAIAPNPAVLLLDEPTSALDPELVNEVLEVIRRLAIEDRLTMIISTHQLRFAQEVADRVVFLSGGVIVEEGPAQEVLTRPRHSLTARFLQVMNADDLKQQA